MIVFKNNEINIFSLYYSQMSKLDNSILELNLINTTSKEVKVLVFTYELFKNFITFTVEAENLTKGDWSIYLMQGENERLKEKIIVQ